MRRGELTAATALLGLLLASGAICSACAGAFPGTSVCGVGNAEVTVGTSSETAVAGCRAPKIVGSSIGSMGAASEAGTLYVTRHPAMGTTWELYLYAANSGEAEKASDLAFEEVDRIEDLLSNYRESSELSRINRLAAGETVTTDPETFGFLMEAQHWSEASDGAFDLTVGALMKGWGFFRRSGRVPSTEELANLGARTGWRKMRLDPAARGVRFTVPGLELDPGGIGKGFAVESVLRLLRENGVTAAMLSAGSSTIGTVGAPPGKPGWRVVVHDPWDAKREVSTAVLRDETLSTANCAEKNFRLGGHLYCHILDPRRLRPVEGMLQVTVVDRSATASDALSNVLFVQLPNQSELLLRGREGSRALIVTGDRQHARCSAIHWTATIAGNFCEEVK